MSGHVRSPTGELSPDRSTPGLGNYAVVGSAQSLLFASWSASHCRPPRGSYPLLRNRFALSKPRPLEPEFARIRGQLGAFDRVKSFHNGGQAFRPEKSVRPESLTHGLQ